MNTMRYTEKKKSFKGFTIFLLLFFAIGGFIIYFAITNEHEPVVIGDVSKSIDTSSLKNVENNTVSIDDLNNIEVLVTDKTVTDSSNSKFKGNMVLPVISIDSQELTELNNTIEEDFNKMYKTLKSSNSNVDNPYTYKVTYDTYDNIVGQRRVLSVVIYERITDDSKKNTTTMDKYYTYNIDVSTKETLEQCDILVDLLGANYKDVLKNKVKDYVVNQKGYIKESKYAYTCTEMENFYVNDSKLHLIFNEGDMVEDQCLDIEIDTDI